MHAFISLTLQVQISLAISVFGTDYAITVYEHWRCGHHKDVTKVRDEPNHER